MHFKWKLFAVLMGVCILPPSGSSIQERSLPPAESQTLHQLIRYQIEQNFSLPTEFTKSDIDQIVREAIAEANPHGDGLPKEHARLLARDLVQVTSCLGIDPIIFTALIWRESNFHPQAVSERGAVGLTQMTLRAVQEVLERTHFDGKRRLKYARQLFKKCAPSVFRNLPAEVTPETVAHMKQIISISTLDGMVFGAFLLKLNLAGIRAPRLQWPLYQKALERYNGDPRVKTAFARDVLALSQRMLGRAQNYESVASNDSRSLQSNPEL